jgi:DNA/RNA-binding domain of Phe-tRNA-synthetase-like protein
MHFQHSPEIWTDYPQLVAAAFVLDHVRPDVDVDSALEFFYSQARGRQQRWSEGDMPEIGAWRRAFSQMDLKPTKYRCAAESLLRRFRQEGNLPRFHPLVDLCNSISLATAIPIAVFDIAHVSEYLEVKYATGEEEYLAFSDEVENPMKGEVVFADAAGKAHARRWTFRQSKRSIVTAATTRVLVVVEALHADAKRDVEALMENLQRSLKNLWGTPERAAMLAPATPRLEFA